MVSTLITFAAESSHESAGIGPYLVGLGTFVFLLSLVFALLAFAGGREHS